MEKPDDNGDNQGVWIQTVATGVYMNPFALNC